MSRLRQSLGESTKDTRLIKTVYGEGYVLAAKVERVPRSESLPNATA